MSDVIIIEYGLFVTAVNDPRANELVNLYMTALKYISTQSIVSVKKLR
jgi:hypothetical protein